MLSDRRAGACRTLHLVGQGLLDLIYPPACLLCGRRGPAICPGCVETFTAIPEPVCTRCGRPEDVPGACRLCTVADAAWGGWAFERARASAIYEGPLRQGIHLLKYRGAVGLGEPLGAWLANRCVAEGLLEGPSDAVVPMPLTARRRRQRGYNQAELLAAPVAAMCGIPLLTKAVRRTRNRPAQRTLALEARWRNVDAACFTVEEMGAVQGRRLLVVDDVFTTGATVQGLAAALRLAGADRVDVVTLAAGG